MRKPPRLRYTHTREVNNFSVRQHSRMLRYFFAANIIANNAGIFRRLRNNLIDLG